MAEAGVVIALIDEVVEAIKADTLTVTQVLSLTPSDWVLVASELADQAAKLENQSKAKPQGSLIAQLRGVAASEQKAKPAKSR